MTDIEGNSPVDTLNQVQVIRSPRECAQVLGFTLEPGVSPHSSLLSFVREHPHYWATLSIQDVDTQAGRVKLIEIGASRTPQALAGIRRTIQGTRYAEIADLAPNGYFAIDALKNGGYVRVVALIQRLSRERVFDRLFLEQLQSELTGALEGAYRLRSPDQNGFDDIHALYQTLIETARRPILDSETEESDPD